MDLYLTVVVIVGKLIDERCDLILLECQENPMRRKLVKQMCLLCCLLIWLSACASVRASNKRYYSAPLPKVWEATSSTLKEMDIEPKVKDRDYFGGLVKAKLYDGTSLTIELTRKAGDVTEVIVKFGTFGDTEKSEMVHTKISSRLNLKKE